MKLPNLKSTFLSHSKMEKLDLETLVLVPHYRIHFENLEDQLLGTSNYLEGYVFGNFQIKKILKNASNIELAKKFLEFSLSEDFQKHIPQGNWMYPVIDLQGSQSDFYNAAPKPKSLDQVFPSSTEKEKWISNWEASLVE